MDSSQRLSWLRRLLLVKVVVTAAVWALPALLAPPSLFPLLGLTMPEDPLFLRSFGALAATLALAYWYAYQDPVQNGAIVKVGVVDNALATLVVVGVALTTGVTSWFAWLSGLLTATFSIVFALLRPRP